MICIALWRLFNRCLSIFFLSLINIILFNHGAFEWNGTLIILILQKFEKPFIFNNWSAIFLVCKIYWKWFIFLLYVFRVLSKMNNLLTLFIRVFFSDRFYWTNWLNAFFEWAWFITAWILELKFQIILISRGRAFTSFLNNEKLTIESFSLASFIFMYWALSTSVLLSGGERV